MYKQICAEYFGDISAELLLQNMTNANHNHNTIDDVREFVRGFTVSAEYEFAWEGDSNFAKTHPPVPNRKRFVRLVLEPLE
jgi:hypothetical protein